MHTDPLAFLEREIPAQFARGIEALRAATSPEAKAQLDDVLGARGALRIVVEGEGEVWLEVVRGVLTTSRSRPEGLPARAVIAFAAQAAREALSLLAQSGRMDDPDAPRRFARLFSARAEKILENERIEFHVVITDVPDLDEVVIKVGIGTDQVPATPQFTATISYDDLEDMREGAITPNQVIGRMRLKGDASRAMALGMKLLQPPTR